MNVLIKTNKLFFHEHYGTADSDGVPAVTQWHMSLNVFIQINSRSLFVINIQGLQVSSESYFRKF